MATPHTLCILDIDRTCIKAVLVTGQAKRAEIVRCAHHAIGAAEEPGPLLQEMLAGSPPVVDVVSAIARDQALARLLVLPSLLPEELAQMVELQAKSQLPYAKEDVIADYLTVSQSADGSSVVLMVGVHRELIAKHLQALQQAALSPRAITMTTQGLLAWYAAQRPVGAGPARLAKPREAGGAGELTALLDVDYDAAELLILEGTACLFTRSLPFGTRLTLDGDPQYLPANQWEDGLGNEVERSFASFAMERRGQTVTRLILTGARQAGLEEALGKRLGIACEFRDAAEAVKHLLPIAPTATLPAQEASVSWAAAYGLALAASSRLMNLLPKTVRREQTAAVARRALVTMAWLVCALLLVIGGGGAAHLTRSLGYEHEIAQRLRETDEPARQVERLTRRLQRVRAGLESRGRMVRLLQELYRITPSRLSLANLSCEAAKELTLKGSATQRSDIPAYISALEESPIFEGVSLKYSTKRRAKDADVTDFEITAQISAGAAHETVAQR
ncbi:MAG: pilus assembly protein PilM [Candidatus Omnitrophica bacterium]|nr:pilus assembly protein PilM [Candidatus Omnitrophota bacterium]